MGSQQRCTNAKIIQLVLVLKAAHVACQSGRLPNIGEAFLIPRQHSKHSPQRTRHASHLSFPATGNAWPGSGTGDQERPRPRRVRMNTLSVAVATTVRARHNNKRTACPFSSKSAFWAQSWCNNNINTYERIGIGIGSDRGPVLLRA